MARSACVRSTRLYRVKVIGDPGHAKKPHLQRLFEFLIPFPMKVISYPLTKT